MCMVLQEGVQRALMQNISAIASGRSGGISANTELPLRGIIRSVCASESWTARRFLSRFDRACAKLIGDPDRDIERNKTPKDTYRFTLYQWREQSAVLNAPSNENMLIYGEDPGLALRMKRAVCGDNGEYSLGVCSEAELPPATWAADTCVAANPCEMCRAIVAGAVGVVQQSRERPKVTAGQEYDALVARMAGVCEEMPMREPIAERGVALEACQDMWEEHEQAFLRLAVDRSLESARDVCSATLGLCDAKLTPRQVFAFDPRRAAGDGSARTSAADVDSFESKAQQAEMPEDVRLAIDAMANLGSVFK